ncbi:MAG: O-antigen ligase family protein [Phycisphaerales bacterium]
MINKTLTAPWINRFAAERAFRRQSDRLPWGEAVHLLFAVLFCASVGLPMTAPEIGLWVLVPIWLIGLVAVRGTQKYVLLQPVTLLGLAFAAWTAIGLFWTPDRMRGLEQWGALRFGLAVLAMWPVLRWRGILIGAMAVGCLAGNMAQVVVWWAEHEGVDWLVPGFVDHGPGRVGGWWPPVYAGLVLVAALGLHLPAALMGRGWQRWAGLAGAAVSLAGIGVTGTRGAWIAAAGLIVLCAGVAILRARAWKPVIVGAVVALVVGAGVWAGVGSALSARVSAVWTEASRALKQGDYNSDNGLRVLMAIWAVDGVGSDPVAGVGTGGYSAWVAAHADRRDAAAFARFRASDHGHCHNAILQAAATGGVVGALLLLAWVGAGVYAGMRAGVGYAQGPAWALVGLLLMAPFDAWQVNGQSAAVLGVLLALCPGWLPPRLGEWITPRA